MNLKANHLTSIFLGFLTCYFVITYCVNTLAGVENRSKISKFKLPNDIKAKVKDLSQNKITTPALKMFDNSFTVSGITVYATSKTPMYYLAYILKGLAKLDSTSEQTPDNATVVIFDFDKKNGELVPKVFSKEEWAVHEHFDSIGIAPESLKIFYAGIAPENRADNLNEARYKNLQDRLSPLPRIFSTWKIPSDDDNSHCDFFNENRPTTGKIFSLKDYSLH